VADFDRFLTPIQGESPCGPDLEYDNDFLALNQAAVGKLEQQFGDTVIPAVEPNWREVDQLAQALMLRTKDLRIVAWLTLANTYLHGVAEFASGLKLALTLCTDYWESVHPRLEIDGDTDPYLRMNAIAAFSGSEFSGEDRLIQALRASALLKQPAVITFRDAELAFANAPDATYSLSQIETTFNEALAANNPALVAVTDAYAHYQALRALLDERISAAEAPDMDRLAGVLKPVARGIERLRQVAADIATADGAMDVGAQEMTASGQVVATGNVGTADVRSREDVRRALDRVCQYLERHEPSNPASLFARRAQRMLDMPFLDIMMELSPDSVSTLENLTGAKARQADA
jgi:type VI secretion system protein ImpA